MNREKILLAFLDSLHYEYEPDFGQPQTIEAYNDELEKAIANVHSGKFTTQNDLEKEMQLW